MNVRKLYIFCFLEHPKDSGNTKRVSLNKREYVYSGKH